MYHSCDQTFIHFSCIQVRATLKLGRNTVSEHRLELEGLALQDITLVRGIRLNYNGFNAKTLNAVVLAIVLHKYPAHHWG